MPEAVIKFPGIERIVTASIPRAHGITPDCITIGFIPQARKWKRTGAITMTYRGRQIVLPDCLADEVHYTFDATGQLWNVKIWDFRWRWRYDKSITGRYNVRLPDGPVDRLDPLTEKSLSQLMDLCLFKMKLPNGVKIIGKIPKIYPEVIWNHANPARELQRLCEMSGHRIVAQFDGSITLVPLGKDERGVTATMPKGFPVRAEQASYDPPEAPEKYIYVCGSTKYQYTLPLEAVGDDIDGLIKPIDDLSYKPRGKEWGECDLLYFQDVELVRDMSKWYNLPNPRQLAAASVFRKYRIKVTKGTGNIPYVEVENSGTKAKNKSKDIYIPGCPVTVKDVRQILPLGSELIEPVKTTDGWFKETPVIIWGQFCWGATSNNYDEAAENNDRIPKMLAQARDQRTGLLLPNNESTVVQPEDYQIDYENGIVTINGPMNGRMCRLVRSGGRTIFKPARLWMRGTCQVKQYGVWVPIREEVEVKPPPNIDYVVGGRQYIEDKEIFLRNVPVYNQDKITLKEVKDNQDVIDKEAKARMEAELKKLQELKPQHSELAGIYPIRLNGGIQQVVYDIGQTGAFTKVSLHNEFWVMTMTYEERRFLEKADDERRNNAGQLEAIRQKDMPFSKISGVSSNRGR